MAQTEHTGSGFVLRGNAYYHANQYEKALEAYKTALEKETLPIARWNIHNRLCATYTKLKDYDSALHEAELMIQSDPDHPKGYVRKGGAFFFRGEYELALDEYAKATALIDEAVEKGKADKKLAVNLTEYITSTTTKKEGQ